MERRIEAPPRRGTTGINIIARRRLPGLPILCGLSPAGLSWQQSKSSDRQSRQ